MLTRTQATLFRRWTLGDPSGLEAARDGTTTTGLANGPTTQLVRIAVLIAMDAGTPAYQREVNAALAAGATADDLMGVLCAVAGVVGSAHVMSAAPRLAMALGYDVEADLEQLDDRPPELEIVAG